MRSRFETPFAVVTMAAALLHFSGETYYHVLYGQPFSAYLVDLIAIGLMLLAAGSSLLRRDLSAAGWLAAGWAFTLCLNYRSYLSRIYALDAGNDLEEPSMVLTILGVTLVTNAIMLVVAMWLARPRRS